MSRARELYNYLKKLPDREFETGREFEEEVVPKFYSILCYDPENVFYEITINRQQETTFLDSIAANSPDADPWLVVEVRKYTDTSYPEKGDDIDGHIYRDLTRYSGISNAEYTTILTNRAIGVEGPQGQFGFDYDDITIDDCEQIIGLLSPPEEFSEEEEIQNPTSDTLGEISTANFQLDLDEFDEYLFDVFDAETSNEKGDRLEDSAEFLIEGVPHFSVKDRNLRTLSGEIDLVVENSETHSAINCHSRYFLVECKNWKETVGADEVRNFAGKLESSNSNLGIIFARNGISGSEGENAKKVINDKFQQKGIAIVVFRWRDLLDIREGNSFYRLLEEKIYNRRFPT
jgi:hypothetical protein